MAALKRLNPENSFWGLGGDNMAREGLDSLFHVKDLSVTGFWEVLKHFFFFMKVMGDVVSQSEQRKPDAAILLDYPGFNIRLGLKLSALGIPVYYYISPQVWAWKKGRVKTMRQFIKRIFVIFPFEVEFYKDQGIPVSFSGHPVVEKDFALGTREAFFKEQGLDLNRPLVALLPGSRRNELERHIEPLMDAISILKKEKPELQYLMAGLTSLSPAYYDSFLEIEDLTLLQDDPYPIMAFADVAIVASGTATLETAYLGTPLVVFYKVAPISYLIGKLLVDIEHLAMPNLIVGERAIPELIQGDATGKQIAKHTLELLDNSTSRNVMLKKLGLLQNALGQPGCADLIATKIIEELDS